MMNTALARLRAKTDQDLGVLVARQLQRSLARVHRTNYQDAVRVYETSRALIAVADLPPADRERLECLLGELRSHLEQPASAMA
jgi:hypothetical protein